MAAAQSPPPKKKQQQQQPGTQPDKPDRPAPPVVEPKGAAIKAAMSAKAMTAMALTEAGATCACACEALVERIRVEEFGMARAAPTPLRLPLFAARALNATGQFRVILSLSPRF